MPCSDMDKETNLPNGVFELRVGENSTLAKLGDVLTNPGNFPNIDDFYFVMYPAKDDKGHLGLVHLVDSDRTKTDYTQPTHTIVWLFPNNQLNNKFQNLI